jgi:hypothetical protein
VDSALGDDMLIVQHQHEGFGYSGDLIDQCCCQLLKSGWLRRFQPPLYRMPDLDVDALQRCDQIGKEPDRLIIPFVEGEPGKRYVCRVQPRTDQGSLAIACRGRHQRQFAIEPCIQMLDQSWARHYLGPGRRDIEFCRQQWRGHFPVQGWSHSDLIDCAFILPHLDPTNKHLEV